MTRSRACPSASGRRSVPVMVSLQVVASAGDQDLVGLAGIEIETGVDDRLFDRRAGGGDAHPAASAAGRQ